MVALTSRGWQTASCWWRRSCAVTGCTQSFAASPVMSTVRYPRNILPETIVQVMISLNLPWPCWTTARAAILLRIHSRVTIVPSSWPSGDLAGHLSCSCQSACWSHRFTALLHEARPVVRRPTRLETTMWKPQTWKRSNGTNVQFGHVLQTYIFLKQFLGFGT